MGTRIQGRKRMEKTKKSQRKSNIELLRALLMFLVIILHYNNAEMGGAFAVASGASLNVLKFMETVSVCAVNCFILISAYFMSTSTKRSFQKPVHLLGMVIGYQLLSMLGQMFLTKTVPFQWKSLIFCLIPSNWFVVLFCVLYLVSVYVNPLFSVLSKKQLQQCIWICLALFVIYPTLFESGLSYLSGTSEWPGLGTVTMSGSAGGYTIVNFMILYLIGGYLRKYPLKWNSLQCFGGFLAASVLDFILGLFCGTYTSYANIFVVIQAVMLFLTFLKWDMKSSAVINDISKSAFGIYLIHTSSFMIRDFWGHFRIQEYAQKTAGVVFVHLIIACIAMYVACLVIDIVCRSIVSPIVRKIEKWIHYASISC